MAKILPDKFKLDAQSEVKTEKALSAETAEKLEGIKDELRTGLSPEDKKLAMKLLKQMSTAVSRHYSETKKIYAQLKPISEEKTRFDDILSGKAEPDFEDIGFDEISGGTVGSSAMLNTLAYMDLSEKEKSIAYSLYGNDYLKARSDVLQEKTDVIKQKLTNLNRRSFSEMGEIKSAWDAKFSGVYKMQKLMNKVMIGANGFADPNAGDLLGELQTTLDGLKQNIIGAGKAISDFAKLLAAEDDDKVYA